MKRYRELWIVLALVLLALAGLWAAGQGGWPGEPDTCLVAGRCFCELDRGGLVRQPANTLSNLGFVAAGLGIAWQLGRERAAGRATGAMGGSDFHPGFYLGFYGALVALLGPGSMALHASLSRWGSVLDLVSMNLFIGFVFSYALVRWRGLGPAHFLASFVVLNAALLSIKLIHGHGSGAFGVMAVASVGVELRARRSRQTRSDGRLLAAAAGTFLASFAVWLASQNDSAFCNPESWLQGHGLWHLGCALSALFLFGYMRSERPASGSVDTVPPDAR